MAAWESGAGIAHRQSGRGVAGGTGAGVRHRAGEPRTGVEGLLRGGQCVRSAVVNLAKWLTSGAYGRVALCCRVDLG